MVYHPTLRFIQTRAKCLSSFAVGPSHYHGSLGDVSLRQASLGKHRWNLTNIWTLTAWDWIYNAAAGDPLENEKLTQRILHKFLWSVLSPPKLTLELDEVLRDVILIMGHQMPQIEVDSLKKVATVWAMPKSAKGCKPSNTSQNVKWCGYWVKGFLRLRQVVSTMRTFTQFTLVNQPKALQAHLVDPWADIILFESKSIYKALLACRGSFILCHPEPYLCPLSLPQLLLVWMFYGPSMILNVHRHLALTPKISDSVPITLSWSWVRQFGHRIQLSLEKDHFLLGNGQDKRDEVMWTYFENLKFLHDLSWQWL